MSKIVKRSVKGSALTSGEIDANVNNLNNDKVEIANSVFTGTPSLINSLIPLANTILPSIYPSLNLDFANSKTLDSRITFTRNSVATYYDGKTFAKAEENLLGYSNSIVSASYTSSTSNGTINSLTSTAPDGTNTATYMLFIAVYGNLQTTGVTLTSGLPYVLSFWAKTDTSVNTLSVWTAGLNQGLGTFTPTSSWVRYTVSFTGNSGISNFQFQDRNPASTYGGIWIWGAQLEQRSAVSSYTPTTTVPITNYIPQLMTAPVNVPRFDFDPITKKSLGLLIEEGRTNLITNSASVAAGYVNDPTKLTVYPNSVIAPDGTLTASLFSITSPIVYNYNPSVSSTLVVGCPIVHSVYIKDFAKTARSEGYGFGIGDGSGTRVSLSVAITATGDMSLTSTTLNGYCAYSSSLTAVGNGWYRMSASYVADRQESGGGYNITGGSLSIAIWGVQVEKVGSSTRTNTLGTGSTTTSIVLDAGATTNYTGQLLLIYGYKSAIITAYNTATQTATIANLTTTAHDVGTAPASGLSYIITPNVATFPTSYIPTSGTSVSRIADNASMTGLNFSSWYNQSQGALYAELNLLGISIGVIQQGVVFGDSAGLATSLLQWQAQNSSGLSRFLLGNGVVNNIVADFTAITSTYMKGALSYYQANCVAAFNGSSTTNISITTMPPIINKLEIGNSNGIRYLNGHMKKLTYYPKALSATELAGLTS